RLETLSERVEELAKAQRDTDARLDRLTDIVTGLALQVGRLTEVVDNLAGEVGSLSRSMSYALENEAYRLLPALLEREHGIILHERIIRTEILGEEVNFFARGERNGQPVCLVGEAKLQLDEKRYHKREKVFSQLQARVEVVRKLYPDCEVIPILVTHFARPAFLKEAQELGILVVQSYEW
ncbi:MAG: hypothetical protein N2383_08855, partial [Caldilineales bacterium]|nr:hypothetical protein [Caldilineales bacterium]